jgi:hypothetical protein
VCTAHRKQCQKCAHVGYYDRSNSNRACYLANRID